MKKIKSLDKEKKDKVQVFKVLLIGFKKLDLKMKNNNFVLDKLKLLAFKITLIFSILIDFNFWENKQRLKKLREK